MNLRQPTSKGNRGIAKSHSKHSITPIRSVNVASPQNPFQIRNKENNAKSFLQKVTGDPNQQSQQSMKSNASLPCGLTINSKPISGLHSVSQSRFNAATEIDARPTTTTSLTLSGVNPISRNATISSFGSTISNLTLSNASFSNNLNLGQTSFHHSSYSSEAELQKLLKNQRIFEKFILDAMKRPLADCVEDLLTDIFHAKDVIFWQDIPSLHMMYSKKLDLVASHSDGLVGYEFFQRNRLILEYPGEHPAYKEDFDKIEGDIPLSLLTFTLFDNNGNVSAVVQIKRIRSNPFTDTQELSFLDYFEEKFPIFFPLYDKVNLQQDVICKMLQEMDIDQFLLHFQKQMVTIFSCRSAEIWKLDQAEHVLHLYKKAKSVVDWSRGGIASEAIDRRYPLNCISNRMMSSYNEDVDGREIESVLCVPLSDLKRNTVHCIVLRGGPEKKVFTSADQTMLQLITPYCVLAMNNIEDEEKNRKSSENEDIEIKGKRCLEALKTIIEQLENKTEIEDIIARVIENLELLTHAERSTLLTVNNKSDMMLNNVFSTSPKFPKTIEPNRTYVARAIELGQVFNIGDCYDEIDFDSSLDLVTNYHTRSLLAVPMKNGKSECFGVVEFCNRTGNTVFPNSDVPFVKIIMNTLGLLIDNRKLENEVVTSSEQLRNFISVSLSTISNSVLQDVFRNILTNINRENNFESSAIFIYNNMRENLTSFISSGEKLQRYLPLSHGFPALAFKSKEVIFSNDALHDSRYVRDPCDSSGVDIRSICIAPIVSFTGNKVFGVLEATNKKNGEHYSAKDINVLRSVATLVALSLENRSMDSISEYGNAEFEIDKWVEEVEKPEYSISNKLKLVTAKKMEFENITFDSFEEENNDLLKFAINVFQDFDLLYYYQINCETIFNIIYHAREAYSSFVIYHNWAHAIDILHFVTFIGKQLYNRKKILKFDLLVLFLAALFQDAGHQGYTIHDTLDDDASNSIEIPRPNYNNSLNVDQSPENVNHCTLMMRLLSSHDSNPFKYMKSDDQKKAWKFLFKLVSATDPINHFSLIKKGNEMKEIH